jgi:hypothetical protein
VAINPFNQRNPRLMKYLRAYKAPLHLSRTLYKSPLFMQNKPNFLDAQMNVSPVKTMNYEQITMNNANKNKPNSKPIQTQSNPIKANIMPKQTQYKPNQTQSLVKDLIALVSAWMFISKTAKKSCARLWTLLQCFSESLDKPGERKAECSARPKLRTDPMNLLGIMPAKEGKIDLKHSFRRSAFCFEFSKNRAATVRER